MAIGSNRAAVGALVAVTVLTLSVLGCGGDNGGSNEVPATTVTEGAPAVTEVASLTPPETSDSTETPAVPDELAQIHEAAVDWVDGVLVASAPECAESDRSCVVALTALPASAAEGMVRLIGADAGGGGAGWIVLGKRADGSWDVVLAGNNLMRPQYPQCSRVSRSASSATPPMA